MARGSAVVAVGLIAVGTTLMSRSHISAAPLPAARTATTGIVLAQTGHAWGGQSEVRFNRDPGVRSNVHFSVLGYDERLHELGVSSTGKPGQKPTAVWKSGMVDGHPVTLGVFPGRISDAPTVTFANGISYPVGAEELKGTGYVMFYVDYSAVATTQKEPARPSEIASIRWSSPSGVIDGIEGDHRLTGRVLRLNTTLSVDVVVRPADGGRSTVSGQTRLLTGGRWDTLAYLGYGFFLSDAATNPSGAAVATGRTPTLTTGKSLKAVSQGLPIAAGILPPGSSDIGVVLTKGDIAEIILPDRGPAGPMLLPDGRVIFAFQARGAQPYQPIKDSIKAVTWTNADGAQGWIAVNQKQG